jgi:nucleotidyltransferase/DNA polymerase involved in DNA repair
MIVNLNFFAIIDSNFPSGLLLIKACDLRNLRRSSKANEVANKAGRTISLGIGYSKESFGGGFNRAKTIDQPTNITMDIYKVCLELFEKFYNGDVVRSIDVRLSNIVDDSELQLSLFDLEYPKRSRI